MFLRFALLVLQSRQDGLYMYLIFQVYYICSIWSVYQKKLLFCNSSKKVIKNVFFRTDSRFVASLTEEAMGDLGPLGTVNFEALSLTNL